MWQDITSVLWKEWKIIFGKRESLRDKFSGAAKVAIYNANRTTQAYPGVFADV